MCRASKQLLDILYRRPLIKLESLNGQLFNMIQDLRVMKSLRSDVLIMKCYFMCCRQARHARILWSVREHTNGRNHIA